MGQLRGRARRPGRALGRDAEAFACRGMRRPVLWRSLALLAVVVCSSGCGRFRMTRECRELSEIVEAGRLEIDEATAPRTPAAYRKSVPLYRRVADQLRRLSRASELRRSVEEYARSVAAIGPLVQNYAEALASGDAARETTARKELDAASRKERLASRRLEDQCHGRIQVF